MRAVFLWNSLINNLDNESFIFSYAIIYKKNYALVMSFSDIFFFFRFYDNFVENHINLTNPIITNCNAIYFFLSGFDFVIFLNPSIIVRLFSYNKINHTYQINCIKKIITMAFKIHVMARHFLDVTLNK